MLVPASDIHSKEKCHTNKEVEILFTILNTVYNFKYVESCMKQSKIIAN